MIILSATWVGLRSAQAVRCEMRLLRQLQRAIELMQCEIGSKLTPVPELCELVSNALSGPMRQYFAAFAQRLRLQQELSVHAAFGCVLAGGALPQSVLQLLLELGSVLGCYDAHEQLQLLDGLLQRLKQALQQLQQGSAARCRSYQVMGVCAGCALAILLI